LEPEETAFVAKYQKMARIDVEKVLADGRVAIVVGGSGLYVKALLDDMNFPKVDFDLRAELEKQAELHGTPALYEMLQKADPLAAKSIEPNNTRRIIRALEVVHNTKKPFKSKLPQESSYFYENTTQIGVRMANDVLDERIEKRVDVMREQGLLAEVESLANRLGDTARKAIGYKELLEYLRGDVSLDFAFDQIKLHTRQLVRKQNAWFKRDTRINWDTKTAIENALLFTGNAQFK
jgi:tRNA dimethylallyltransferase